MPVQTFWARPEIKLHLVPVQTIFVLSQKLKKMEKMFWSITKSLGLAQYVNRILVLHKKLGPAQNIVGPIKGQGIRPPKYFLSITKLEKLQDVVMFIVYTGKNTLCYIKYTLISIILLHLFCFDLTHFIG